MFMSFFFASSHTVALIDDNRVAEELSSSLLTETRLLSEHEPQCRAVRKYVNIVPFVSDVRGQSS